MGREDSDGEKPRRSDRDVLFGSDFFFDTWIIHNCVV